MQPLIEIQVPKNLGSNIDGFEFIAKVSLRTYKTKEHNVVLDFLNNDWIDANLCAPLGALIDDLQSRNNIVLFQGMQLSAESVFRHNGFSEFLDPQKTQEKSYLKKIDFKRFSLNDYVPFQEYINDQLLAHEDLPNMSNLLKKEVNKSILEIFNNAHSHGQSSWVYTCGEYFSKENRLKFTISDMGTTIRKNVNDYFGSGSKIDGKEALEWAVEEGNTTKSGSIPGGLGLSLIRQFLTLNGGAVQIISSNGYWEEQNGLTFGRNLESRFLGTIVNLEFNLNDNKRYALKSEIDPRSVL